MKARTYLILLLFLILIGCDKSNTDSGIIIGENGEWIYEVARQVNGTVVYDKKTLDQINKDDLTDGNFMYRVGDGSLMVTDIKTEEDRQLAERYSIDLFRNPEFVVKYDEFTGMEKPFVKFNREMLSYHPLLKSFDPDFFMSDYELNWRCHGILESYHRLQQCDFSIQCEIEADFYFEKWCMRRIAELTNNVSWCDNVNLNVDWECYWSVAIQRKDSSLCWKIKGGDNPVMNCFADVAKFSENPEICDQMSSWYENALKNKENNSNLSGQLSEKRISDCKDGVEEYKTEKAKELAAEEKDRQDSTATENVESNEIEDGRFSEVTEIIHCNQFPAGSTERQQCEKYVYDLKGVNKNDVSSCSGLRLQREILNCIDTNSPLSNPETLPMDEDQSCDYNGSAYQGTMIAVGRVIKVYKNWKKLDSLEVLNSKSRFCRTLSCSSDTSLEGINLGDGIYMIVNDVQWEEGGSVRRRCNITEIKQVFKP